MKAGPGPSYVCFPALNISQCLHEEVTGILEGLVVESSQQSYRHTNTHTHTQIHAHSLSLMKGGRCKVTDHRGEEGQFHSPRTGPFNMDLQVVHWNWNYCCWFCLWIFLLIQKILGLTDLTNFSLDYSLT